MQDPICGKTVVKVSLVCGLDMDALPFRSYANYSAILPRKDSLLRIMVSPRATADVTLLLVDMWMLLLKRRRNRTPNHR